MSNKPEIRSILLSEWSEYRDIRLRALKESPEAFGSTYARESGFSDVDWKSRLEISDPVASAPVVACHGGRFVGLAWGKIESPDRHIAHLYQMWVDPKHRGFGLGRLLVEAVIDWAQGQGVRTMMLEVTEGERPARSLYEALGFQPVGELIPQRPGSDLLEQTMILKLTQQDH